MSTIFSMIEHVKNYFVLYWRNPLLWRTNLYTGTGLTKKSFFSLYYAGLFSLFIFAGLSFLINPLSNIGFFLCSTSLSLWLLTIGSITLYVVVCNILGKKKNIRIYHPCIRPYLFLICIFLGIGIFIAHPQEPMGYITYNFTLLFIILSCLGHFAVLYLMSYSSKKWFVLRDLEKRQIFHLMLPIICIGIVSLSSYRTEYTALARCILLLVSLLYWRELSKKKDYFPNIFVFTTLYTIFMVVAFVRAQPLQWFQEHTITAYLSCWVGYLFLIELIYFSDYLALPSIDPKIAKNFSIEYLLFDPRFYSPQWEQYAPTDDSLELCFTMLEQHIPSIRMLYEFERTWPNVQKQYLLLQEQTLTRDDILECDF